MSSLILAHDLQIIMLEVAVENLFVPWSDVFDEALMKKTVIMFRMLDDEWTSLSPNRPDYHFYRGSNYEKESFYGGRSVLFSLPEFVLEKKVSGVDVQFFVSKGISEYFELNPRQNFGFTLVSVDDLLNGIIKDLQERKDLADYMSSSLDRAPISRSTRGIYTLLDEDERRTEYTIELYIRISYLGKCIVTEIHSPWSTRKAFYAREETAPQYAYQLRELTMEDLLTGCWGSATILPPLKPEHLKCRCEEYERLKGALMESAEKLKKKRKRKSKWSYEDELARILALLALLKKLRKGKSAINVGLHEKPKKICSPPCVPCPTICSYPLPCQFYQPCSIPCQPIAYCPPMQCALPCCDRF